MMSSDSLSGQRRSLVCSAGRWLTLVFVLLAVLPLATGRPGCLDYGHSCLGGHGKRNSRAFQDAGISVDTHRFQSRRNYLPVERDSYMENYPGNVESMETRETADQQSNRMDAASLWRNLMLAAQH